MKDSRLGTFGVLALGIAVALKVFAVAALTPGAAAAALIAAHAGGRFAAIGGMAFLPYAGDISTAKAKPLATNITVLGLAVAACFGLPPTLLLPPSVGLAACLVGSPPQFSWHGARNVCSAASRATCLEPSSKATRSHFCWRLRHAFDPGPAS